MSKPKNDPQTLVAMAQTAEKAGDLEAATTLYGEALNINSRCEDALEALLELRLDMGNQADAIRLCKALATVNTKKATRHMAEILVAADDAKTLLPIVNTLPIEESQKKELLDLAQTTSSFEIEPANDSSSLDFTDADIAMTLDLYCGREGVHARQWRAPDGRTGYSPIHQPLRASDIRAHLCGDTTLGIYVVRRDNQVCFAAIDVDIITPEVQSTDEKKTRLKTALNYTRTLWRNARAAGFTPLCEWSGYKGYHLWFFFDEPWPAHKARRLLQHLVTSAGTPPPLVHTDLFPAQSHVKKGGLGNLIKLPLGIHLKSGQRSTFLDDSGKPIDHPQRVLKEIQKIPTEHADDLYTEIRTSDPSVLTGEDNSKPQPKGENAESTTYSREQVVVADDYRIDDDEELAWLGARCDIIGKLKKKCEAGHPLSHDEQRVLIHTVGHLTCGPNAVNTLLRDCGDGFQAMKNRLRGHPTSCRKIRQRLGVIPEMHYCECRFDPTLGSYSHPLLHLAELGFRGDDKDRTIAELARVEKEIFRLQDVATRLRFGLTPAKLPEASAEPVDKAPITLNSTPTPEA